MSGVRVVRRGLAMGVRVPGNGLGAVLVMLLVCRGHNAPTNRNDE